MHPALKWTLRILGGIVGLILLLLIVVYVWSEIKLGRDYDMATESVELRTDSASLAHGKYLATAVAKCGDCHGADLGGTTMFSDPAIGTIIAPNLTAGEGSATKGYAGVEDWVRSVRYGVGTDGKGLAIMPAHEYWWMSDRELGSVLAYVQSVPPVNRAHEANSYDPMGRALFAFGMLPIFRADVIDRTADRGPEPVPGVTPQYGEHLARVGGCIGCHGEDLSGGPIPGHPPDFLPGANLTPHEDGLKGYDLTKFTAALRQGKRKDGGALDAEQMPWASAGLMTDQDIAAIWSYISSVPPKESLWAEK